MDRPPSSPSRRNYEIVSRVPKVLKGPQTDHIIWFKKWNTLVGCPLYLAVRVEEGRQLSLLRLKSQAKKKKFFNFFFSWTISSYKNFENWIPTQECLLIKVALWRAQYDESCKLCSGGSYCLSLASMVESIREAWKTVAYPVADVSGSSPLVSSQLI